ncbi:MAG: hypothetical protein KDA05_01370 [Phycisphaerales bacterium]|nr:hypothetical protein [Phycisphaerales bacterium]
MPWVFEDIAAAVAQGLRRRAAMVDAEQGVRGLEALEEVGLHPVVAAGLEGEGFGVLREQGYPGVAGAPIRRERERCDVVVLPRGGTRLLDPVTRRLERRAASGTLFESHVAAEQERESGGGEEPADGGVACDEALWLEVKLAAQYAYTDGVPGPNPSYVADMTAFIGDLAKLARDQVILHAAAVVVLFSQCEATLRHDLGVAVERALAKDLPLAAPAVECFPMTDRIGNAVCGVAVVGLRKATVVGW